MYSHLIPVSDCVLATWRSIWREGASLLVALALPAVCISLIEFAGREFPGRFPYTLLVWALSAPFYVLFAVICHRSVILGGDSLPNRFGLFWTARETGFLGWTIALMIATWLFGIGAVLLALLSPFPQSVTLILVWLGLGYLYVRLAMVFPATAVDDQASFDRAWSLTADNGLRIIAVIVLSVAPLVLALAVLSYLLRYSGGLWPVIEEIASHVVMVFTVCALSVSYRELIDFETSALP